jgi:hypothetical protein
MYCSLDYDVPFTRDTIRRVLDALAEAVEDNWRDITDARRKPIFVKADSWSEVEFEEVEGGKRTPWFEFSYSPFSATDAEILFSGSNQGQLSVMLTFPRKSFMEEVEGEDEYLEMEREWEDIRKERGESSRAKIGPDEWLPYYDEWWQKYNALRQTPKVWAKNQPRFRHLFDKLLSVFPAKEVTVPHWLLNETEAQALEHRGIRVTMKTHDGERRILSASGQWVPEHSYDPRSGRRRYRWQDTE